MTGTIPVNAHAPGRVTRNNMRRALLPLALLLTVAAGSVIVVTAQQQQQSQTRVRTFSRDRPYPEWEVKVLHPHEIAAGRYAQVRPYELDQTAADGWELVSVTPFVMRNEEHEGPKGERPMVTQVYVSYSFKRLRNDQTR